MRRIRAAAIVTALLPTFGVLAGDDYLEARRLVEQGEIQPLEAIVGQIKQSHPGRILEVELEPEHGSYTYEIELLDASGQVWELKVDAVSGQVIEQERED